MTEVENKVKHKRHENKSFLRNLEVSLKLRPDIFRLILRLRQRARQRNNTIVRLKKYLQKLRKKLSKNKDKPQVEETKTTQETVENVVQTDTSHSKETAGWNSTDMKEKSIAEQVAEAAQSVVDQSGMVYVDSAGMYYDYKTGYYYNPNIGLYYHTSTNCYYTYDERKENFVFHSYPDTTKMSKEQKAHKAYQKNLAKKHKKEKEEMEEESKPKTKKRKRIKSVVTAVSDDKSKSEKKEENDDTEMENDKKDEEDDKKDIELEDGECSNTSEDSTDIENVLVTESEDEDDNDDFVSKHHPPCMRIIVKETNISKLKVGSLFVITKDGGTVGREGESHSFLLRDLSVSKTHLSFVYDIEKKAYVVTDLGSRNGTILNGHRMSEAQIKSPVMVVPHGSILQVSGTKLLCHIHSGNDTCGHCEPGLIIKTTDQEKAYTRTCNVQRQHELELARLKNKYAPQPLAIEEKAYNDRAKTRRETVGSTHNSEKTQQTDLNTEIDSENKGFKLLSKMGWSKGEGLGKEKQGQTEPIPLVNNDSKVGLGAAGSASPVAVPIAGRIPLRLSTKTVRLKQPAKAFRDPLEEDD